MEIIVFLGRLIPHALSLYFFISEAHYLTQILNEPPLSFSEDPLFLFNSIIILKMFLVFFVLPALYLVQLLSHLFGLEPGEHEGINIFQLKLFHKALYFVISVLVIIRIFEAAFR